MSNDYEDQPEEGAAYLQPAPQVNKAQEEKIELIAVGLLDWVLHRFRTTEYDKDVLKWKWDQTLWSCQEIFEEYIREQGIDYKVPAAPPPDAGKEQEAGYWKERCEAAENLIAVMNVPKNEADGHNDSFLLFGERNQIWQKSKQTKRL